MSKKFEQIGRISAAVIALPEPRLGIALDLLNKLTDPAWKLRLTEVLREGLKPVVQEVEAVVNLFDPAKYFVNRKGLSVSVEFIEHILPAYQDSIPKRGIEGVNLIDPPRFANDRDIAAEYLGNSEEARKGALTLDQLAELIDAQWEGKVGKLLINSSNTLPMNGKDGVLFFVFVRFDYPGCGGWCLDACTPENGYCFTGSRLLCNKL